MTTAAPALSRRRTLPRPRGGWLYVCLGLIALIVAVAARTHSWNTSYDPWSWLVWGRQLLYGGLDTRGGPTWKPLPVVFTFVFALFGSAQPVLWIIVARAGALLSVMMAFKVTARIAWYLQPGAPEADWRRWQRLLPAVIAGLIGASALAFQGGYASDSLLGYSEGLATAAMLIALERAYDGHHRQAFAVGMVVAWDRPESWIVWGPYGLWLMWRDPGARVLVITLAILTLAAWFLPQRFGGGSLTSGVNRAHHPRANSAAFSSFPFWNEFRLHAWDSVYIRAKAWAGIAAIIALALGLRHIHDLRRWLSDRHNHAVLAVLLLVATGIGWWVLIALETQAGFSGNDRYLIFGTVLVLLGCGASVGWAAGALARLFTRLGARVIGPRVGSGARAGSGGRAGSGAVAALLAATAAVALIYALLPSGWVGNDLVSIARLRAAIHYQERLRRDTTQAIAKLGGYQAVNACGHVITENFQVPMVAWYLKQTPFNIGDEPPLNAQHESPVAPGQWPATIFQARDTTRALPGPEDSVVRGWERQGADYERIDVDTVTVYTLCHRHPAIAASAG